MLCKENWLQLCTPHGGHLCQHKRRIWFQGNYFLDLEWFLPIPFRTRKIKIAYRAKKKSIWSKTLFWMALCFLLKPLGPNSTEFLFSLVTVTKWMFSRFYHPQCWHLSHLRADFLTHLHFTSHIKHIFFLKTNLCLNRCFFQSSLACFHSIIL